MKPRLSKTLKVSAETHHLLKMLAAQGDVSMASLVEELVHQRQSYIEHIEYRKSIRETKTGVAP